jgi:hypothetical protein
MAEPRPALTTSASIIALLAALVSIDLILIAVHLAKPYFEFLRPHYFSLEADRGIAEAFGYAKQGAVVVALLLCWRRRRSPTFFVWGVVFSILLIDDSFSLHEQVGEWLGMQLGLPAWFGLRPQDIGELLFAAVLGLATLTTLAAALARERGEAVAPSIKLALMLGALVVCGVVVDAIHVIAYFSQSSLAWMLTIVEDGGELLVMSLIAAYAYQLAVRDEQRLAAPQLGYAAER